MKNFRTATKEDVLKSGFLYVRNATSQEISKVAAVCNFQVGLSKSPANLTVTGDFNIAGMTTFEGVTKHNAGLSGSLTRLIDGTSYLVAGNNVTITSASNGQITISSTGGGGGGTGDVVGPSSATDNAVVRFDLTTGKLIQNSVVTIADTTGNITTPGDIAVNGGDITTTAATFNIANTNATTLNIGGAASSINMGLSTALATIGNAEIGAWPGGTAYAVFQHKDVPDTDSYALIQTYNGHTYLNSVSGRSIVLRNYNNTIGTLDNNTISLTGQSGVATTTTIGNTFDTSSTTINAGSGSINIGTTDSARSINIGTAGGAAQTITIGNKGLFSETVIQAGSSFLGVGGQILLSGSTATTYTIGGETGTGTITIGRSTGTYSINLGLQSANTSGQTQTINLGHWSATGGLKNVNIRGDTVTIGDTGGSVAIGRSGAAVAFPGDVTVTGDIAVNGGDITTSAATFNLVNAASTINLGSTAVARSINIGTGAAAQIIAIGTGGASNFIDIGNLTAGTLTTIYGPAVRLYSNGGTITIDSNANGGTVNIDSQGFNSTVNVGNGGAVKTVTIGSTNTTSTTSIQGGTGGVSINSSHTTLADATIGNATVGAHPDSAYTSFAIFGHSSYDYDAAPGSYALLAVGSTGTKNTWLNAPAGGQIRFANDDTSIGFMDDNEVSLTGKSGTATTTTLGNTVSTSSTIINAGSGSIDIGASDSARSINIGKTNVATQTIAIGTGGGANTISIGNFVAGTTTSVSGITLNLYSSGGTVTIDSAGTGGTVNIDAFGYNSTVNVGTGAAIKTTTVGSTNSSSTTTIQGGTNGITLSTGTVSGIAGNIQVGNSTNTYSINVGLQGANTAGRTQTINLGHYIASGGTKNVNIRGDTVTIGDTGGSVTIGRLGAAVSFPGDITVTGDAAINGGDVTTTSATFNLANEASTLNLGTTGIVRTVNIGTGTGAINTNAQTINIGTFSSNSATIRIGNYNSTPASVTTIHGDTLNLNTSDTNGTTNICASAASLGFFGVTAVTRQTGGAATADLAYSSNERDMINNMYTALRNYGLLT